ncbi:MAG: type II secretion system protein N [Pseudomonadota bacterium]|nr:type II secretion system protein N [Pseudomonadota bacterium]
MPVSRSPNRGSKLPRPRPSIWPWVLIVSCAVVTVIAAALPASLVGHFLPPEVRAGDFSGSLWHGSAGKITVNSRNAGALEWWLHPAALLRLAVAVDLHWVKGGSVLEASANFDRHGFAASGIKGGGPLEDLHDFGIATPWRGMTSVQFSELKGDFGKLSTAVGNISVSNLASPQVADDADWGAYELRLAPGAVAADGSVSAELNDSGEGPLEARVHIRLSPSESTGLITGTVKERPDAPAGVRTELDGLSQLHGRDSQGRIPVELEFTF